MSRPLTTVLAFFGIVGCTHAVDGGSALNDLSGSQCTDSEIQVTSTLTVQTMQLPSPWVVSVKNGYRVMFDEGNVRLYVKTRRRELEAKKLETAGLDKLEAKLFGGDALRPVDVEDLGPDEADWTEVGESTAIMHAVEVINLMAHGFLGPVSVLRLDDNRNIASYSVQKYFSADPAGDVQGVRYVTATGDVIRDFCMLDPR